MNIGRYKVDPFLLIVILLFAFSNLSYYFDIPGAFFGLILSIPGVLIAITFHEFAHAWMADRLGDDTPRREGRLSLNPIKHMDPVGILMLLFVGIGWGRPVSINPVNFNRTISIRKANALVAFAGPAMNFILAIVFSIIYAVYLVFGGTFIYTDAGNIIEIIIASIISMNIGLGVFNLIPLPPLDGSKILVAFLPTKARNWVEEHEHILYFVFIIIWVTPISTYIISPFIQMISHWLINLITFIVGLLT